MISDPSDSKSLPLKANEEEEEETAAAAAEDEEPGMSSRKRDGWQLLSHTDGDCTRRDEVESMGFLFSLDPKAPSLLLPLLFLRSIVDVNGSSLRFSPPATTRYIFFPAAVNSPEIHNGPRKKLIRKKKKIRCS